jgi:hypothetical protein
MLQTMPFQEAMEQREQAQKVALEALRNASATENVFRIYKYVHGAPCSFAIVTQDVSLPKLVFLIISQDVL